MGSQGPASQRTGPHNAAQAGYSCYTRAILEPCSPGSAGYSPPTLPAQGGQQVRFMRQEGQWMAQVTERIGAFSRIAVLPVVCQGHGDLAAALRALQAKPERYSSRKGVHRREQGPVWRDRPGGQAFLARRYQESENELRPAPCKYTVMGLGSMALAQMTPYSDLEFALLMEEAPDAATAEKWRKYLRHLTHLVHFRVINLGETVIPRSKYKLPDLREAVRSGERAVPKSPSSRLVGAAKAPSGGPGASDPLPGTPPRATAFPGSLPPPLPADRGQQTSGEGPGGDPREGPGTLCAARLPKGPERTDPASGA